MAAGDPIYWTGGTDTKFDTATNWVGGVVPAANEVPIYPSGNANSCLSNFIAGGREFQDVIVERGYTGQLGQSGTPFLCGISGRFEVRGGSAVFIKAIDPVGGTDNIAELYVETNGGSVTISDDGTKKFKRVVVTMGSLAIDAAMTTGIDVLETSYVGNPATDAGVSIAEGAAAISKVIMAGGRITSNADIASAYVAAGSLHTQGSATVLGSTILHVTGGHVIHDGGNMVGDIEILRGNLDLTQVRRKRTLGASTKPTKVFRGAELLYNPALTTFAGGLAYMGEERAIIA